MSWRRHPGDRLVAYHDREVSPAEGRKIEQHLETCVACRLELDQIRANVSALATLPVVKAPGELWSAIDRALTEQRPKAMWPRFVTAGALAMLALAAWIVLRTGSGAWEIETATGTAHVASGGSVITGQSTYARIRVGSIGTVDVEPGSRVKLGPARAGREYRLELAHGAISATISAPPRIFLVDTPSARAVDLGCAYTMRVDDSGATELHVTAGWVSLEWQGRESLVPAGATCTTRAGLGPILPFFEDASAGFRAAVQSEAVDRMLNEARVRDTLTLWHLLFRVPEIERARVIDRMAALTPLPAGVTREKALALDRETLTRWREELAWVW
jgi:hypothetical protein